MLPSSTSPPCARLLRILKELHFDLVSLAVEFNFMACSTCNSLTSSANDFAFHF